MTFRKPKTPKEEPKKPYKVSEATYDYVQKTMTFSEKFFIEAIRERAAREGILISEDATGSWYGLTRTCISMSEYELTASLTWKEAIKRFCPESCK